MELTPFRVKFVPVALLAPSCCDAGGLKGARPNIILVRTDDQGQLLSYTTRPFLRTPHIDRFAEQPLRFTGFHASPTCSPTRAAALSGRHAWWNKTLPLMVNEDRECKVEEALAVLYYEQRAERGIPDWSPEEV